ncbi:MAG: hypothetical protein JNL79_04105 [Myxococcales bacterium]|nr:hypothetical protein [Myxococcales bacterium]
MAPQVLEKRFSALVAVVAEPKDAQGARGLRLCQHSSLIVGLDRNGDVALAARGGLLDVLPQLHVRPWERLVVLTNRYVGLTRPVLDAALFALYAAHKRAWRVSPLPIDFAPGERAQAEAREVLEALAFFRAQLAGR